MGPEGIVDNLTIQNFYNSVSYTRKSNLIEIKYSLIQLII